MDLHTGSERAQALLNSHLKQWEIYKQTLKKQILDYGRYRARQLDAEPPEEPELTEQEREYSGVIPSIHKDVKGQIFYPERTEKHQDFTEKNPDFFKELRMGRSVQRSLLNYINGRRSVTEIRNCVMAETGRDLEFEKLLLYLDYLKTILWITY